MAEIRVVLGDITEQTDDAIVNAANEALLPGGGVSGAIHRVAGPLLFYACRELGGCEPGDAKITKGYELPATYVIHTVGPVWEGGDADEDVLLARCYRRSLALAQEHKLKTIAFPSISTGVYEFPIQRAAPIAIRAISEFLHENPDTSLERVTVVCFDSETYDAFRSAAGGATIS
jgi:O-acetyl-ADP-ribose deacetylase (regulator of RNase III)